MTQRNETLATAFEQVADRILTVADGLSDAAWSVAPAGEARTVGQIAYHTAEVYHNVSGFIQMALGGQPLPPLTMEIIHGINAEQAARYAGTGRAGALEMLRQNGAATAAMLRTLSDAQLDTGTQFLGHPMTVEGLAQNGLVAHAEEHLASIQAAATAPLAAEAAA
jgi:uncharacterized damage-inducible protein DinB